MYQQRNWGTGLPVQIGLTATTSSHYIVGGFLIRKEEFAPWMQNRRGGMCMFTDIEWHTVACILLRVVFLQKELSFTTSTWMDVDSHRLFNDHKLAYRLMLLMLIRMLCLYSLQSWVVGCSNKQPVGSTEITKNKQDGVIIMSYVLACSSVAYHSEEKTMI